MKYIDRTIAALSVRLIALLSFLGKFFARKVNSKKVLYEKLSGARKTAENGRICYIIGSGPSLRPSDLDAVGDNFSITSNRIYRVFPHTFWRPDLYLFQDLACFLQEVKCDTFRDILEHSEFKFLFPDSFYFHSAARRSNSLFFRLKTFSKEKRYRYEISTEDFHFFDGRSVSITALELARQLGFREIRLLGIDNAYIPGAEYFDANISNIHIAQPAPDIVGRNLSTIHKEFKSVGVEIWNCSPKSPLSIFPRKELFNAQMGCREK